MDNYTLRTDEFIILKDTHVMEGNKKITLILTNQNIIQENRNLWGLDKSSVEYSLLDLKEQDGKPKILISEVIDGKPILHLFFNHCEKLYCIEGDITVRKWMSTIEDAYKSRIAEIERIEREEINAKNPFSPLKEKLKKAKATVESKMAPKTKRIKCPYCGANIEGSKGTVVKCIYCNKDILIK